MRDSCLISEFGRRAAPAAVALLFPILLMAQNYVFGPNVRVNDDAPGISNHMLVSPGQHSIAARGDTVYLVWYDFRNGVHVYFARSNDGGLTFLPNVRVDRSSVGGNPSLAVDDSGVIHVSWMNGNPSGGGFAYYAKSTDGGQSFLTPVRACDSLYGSQPGAPSIAVTNTGRTVYVARYERWNGGGPYAIWLARSTDGGSTFLTPNPLVCLDTTHDLWNPSVAVFRDSTVLVAWERIDTSVTPLDADVYFARSTDAGGTFGPTILLNDTTNNTHTQQGDPSVGVDSSGRVYVIYTGDVQEQGQGFGLVVSSDTGRTFASPRLIPNAQQHPSLFVTPGRQLYVSWYATGYDNPGEWFTYSSDGGNTFLPAVNPMDIPVSESILQWESTVTANEQGRAFVAWCDTRNDPWGFNDDIMLSTGMLAAIEEPRVQKTDGLSLDVTSNLGASTVFLKYSVHEAAQVCLEVYDLLGRRVRTLAKGAVLAGKHVQVWDGRDINSRRVGSGVYIIRLQTPSQSISRKVVML